MAGGVAAVVRGCVFMLLLAFGVIEEARGKCKKALKHSAFQGFDKMCKVVLVPSARLELAQLSPLPPQDSVSTNFTTTAVYLACMPLR